MSCHNPLDLAAVPPLQFHLAGLLQGMETAGFTVHNAGGKGGQRGRSGSALGPGTSRAQEVGQRGGQLSGSCGEGMGVGKVSVQG